MAYTDSINGYKTAEQLSQTTVLTWQSLKKAPVIANRIFDTYEHALAYINDSTSTAIPGLVLTVFEDTDTDKNGAYFVVKTAASSGETNGGELKAIGSDVEVSLAALPSADKEMIISTLGNESVTFNESGEAVLSFRYSTLKDIEDSTVEEDLPQLSFTIPVASADSNGLMTKDQVTLLASALQEVVIDKTKSENSEDTKVKVSTTVEGEGTSGDPYVIKVSVDESSLNTKFTELEELISEIQAGDIDLSAYVSNEQFKTTIGLDKGTTITTASKVASYNANSTIVAAIEGIDNYLYENKMTAITNEEIDTVINS